MFIRAIIWILLFILAYRAVKYILKIMSSDSSKENSKVNNAFKNRGKVNINKDDIIEADFEEIKDNEKDNSK